MEEDLIQVYVKTDAAGNIISVNSSIFLSDPLGWTEIGEGRGDRYAHAQGSYFEKSIRTDRGRYRYKLVEGVPTEKGEEELAAEEAEEEREESGVEPSQEERIKALEEVIKELLIL